MVPLSCSRPPVSRGNQSPLFQLSQNISSGTSFDDARAVVAYVPKRSRITSAQTKFTKEFGSAVSQHLGHLPKSKSPPDSWWWWSCCPGATPNHQGIGSREALSQQQESGQINLHARIIKDVHMKERVRKLESWMKQHSS